MILGCYYSVNHLAETSARRIISSWFNHVSPPVTMLFTSRDGTFSKTFNFFWHHSTYQVFWSSFSLCGTQKKQNFFRKQIIFQNRMNFRCLKFPKHVCYSLVFFKHFLHISNVFLRNKLLWPPYFVNLL